MAKFTRYYNLCPIHDNKEFLGLSSDQDDANIIATMGRNIIIIINLKTQKQLHSWTVFDKLSCRVVYDKTQNSYVGVFGGGKYIRTWNNTVTDLNSVQKLKFQKTIVDLIATENEETLILYEDGNCESLRSGIEGRKEKPIKFSDIHLTSIQDPNISKLYDGRKLLTYFYKNVETNHIELATLFLEETHLKPLQSSKMYQLKRHDQDVTLSGYTVIKTHYFPSLLTIWSDRRIFLLPLDDNLSKCDVPGNILSMLDILNVNQPLSVIGMSNNCIAIYGSNNGQEGSSLILYNTQFKVIKAKQFFKIYFDISRLWVIGNHILLAMGQNLCIVSYRVSQELLCDIIGSQVTNDIQIYVADDLINEEYDIEDRITYAKQQKSTQSIQITNQNINDEFTKSYRLADGNKIPYKSYNKFKNHFNSTCYHNIHLELYATTSNMSNKINLLANYNDRGEFHSNAINIIADELKKTGASEQEITEKLILLLIDSELNDELAVCLRHYTNIPERILCKLLKYALIDYDIQLNENITLNKFQADNNYVNTNLEISKENLKNLNLLINQPIQIQINKRSDLINLILSCSIDYDIISWYMRQEINLNYAIIMLKHLYNIIISPENYLEQNIQNCMEFNEELIILKWFGIILNTHFQKIVLSRDIELIQILLKWHDILLLYKNDIEDLTHISSLLYNLIQKGTILSQSNNKHSKWYFIEEIDLY